MSIKLEDYDQKILVAEDEKQALYIVKWGKVYSFYHQYDKDADEGVQTLLGIEDHWNRENKTLFVTNAFDVATTRFNFKAGSVLSKYPRNKTVTLTQAQQVAIKTAIMLLGNSNSDHAEQAYFHLKSIAEKF